MSGHVINVCSCGIVINQCRCPGPHPTRIVRDGCGRCSQRRLCQEDYAAIAKGEPLPAQYCGPCGRPSSNLTLGEARDRYGYGRTDCVFCQRTDHPRDPAT